MTTELETSDEFIGRAAAFAELMHQGQARKYTGEPYIEHPMQVAYYVSRVTEDKDVLAAAWLHDVVEDTPATFEEISSQFGFSVSGMVRALSNLLKPEDGNREWRKEKYFKVIEASDADVQTIKVADFVSNTPSILMHDWSFARVYLKEYNEALDLFTKADPQLVSMARAQLQRGWFYLEEVIGNAPQDTKILSSGHPSTLGAYKMLATTVFGKDSLAVAFINQKILESENGVGEVVIQEESQMVNLLGVIHAGEVEEPTQLEF